MPSNYKRLGDYIHKVDNRNRDLKVSNLVGLSMTKEFRVSTSNIVGTDMSVYKVVNKWQFSCDFMSVIRVHKFPVVLKTDDEPVLVSPAYTVFEVNDENELNPEYLMMWFKRSEFDRYADFKCDSAIRGGFDWDALCDCMLPIPSIEKQQEIVREYNTIQNRIALNKQLISKVEETGQAIYKQWFVDFEFPDENGKPYKSNGGKMVWCVELEKEIPEGWEYIEIGEIAHIKAGGDKPKIFSKIRKNNISTPIYSNGVTDKGLYGYTDKFNYPKNSITISARGTIGYCVLRNEDFDAIVRLLVVIPKLSNSAIYLWQSINKIEFDDSGSVQNQLTIPQVSIKMVILPIQEVLNSYQTIIEKIYYNKELKENQNQKLEELKDLLLAKMTRVEN